MSYAGSVYIFYGGPNMPLEWNASDANVTFRGTAADDQAGAALAKGDLNNDGIDDALIGSNFATANGYAGAGKVHVIYGSSGWAGEYNLTWEANDMTSGIYICILESDNYFKVEKLLLLK